MENYFAILLSQTDMTICPSCIKKSKPNKQCQNMVCWKKDQSKPLDKSNTILVCCFIAQQQKINHS